MDSLRREKNMGKECWHRTMVKLEMYNMNGED